jgi:diguanylate cyclase (GGDEF)-like protein
VVGERRTVADPFAIAPDVPAGALAGQSCARVSRGGACHWRDARRSATMRPMVYDLLAGVLLVAGSAACVASVLLVRRYRPAWLLVAAGLACAAAAELLEADGDAAAIAAAALVTAGLTWLVARQHADVTRLSWLDAAMGASSSAALAVAVGASAPLALAAGGVLGVVSLSRWRPQPPLIVALAGLAVLGAGQDPAPAAAALLGVAAWLPSRRVEPGPEFSPIVLTALVTFAFTALGLLTVGQFAELPDVTVALAIVTVLTGIARASMTVVERLRESRHQALTDDLTGLGNRRHLVDRLEAAITASEVAGQELALLLVDLDGFKELNDTLGHHAGDQVLRQIGPRLNTLLRAEDTLARLGGDEFAVVLSPGDETSASAAGLRLRSALERSFEVGGIRVHIDASIGIAIYPHHSRHALGLLQRADVAMYEAKRMRTGHEVYLPSRDRHSRERLALVGELHGALKAGELILHYQPKAEVRTGAVRGVEALVRWQHPQRGLLGPTHFLPLVEQSELTRSLTAFVLDRALAEIGGRRRGGMALGVAVNLGPADLLDLGLPSEIERILARHELAPGDLRLEVSEDAVVADLERTIEVLGNLRRIGVGIALDDFGAGRSSLVHLRELVIDELKIDRSFVMRLDEDERDAAITHSIVDLGRRLGLNVVAEGVQTESAWTKLAEWGCHEVQGHLLGRPMTIAELETWLHAVARRPARKADTAHPPAWPRA